MDLDLEQNDTLRVRRNTPKSAPGIRPNASVPNFLNVSVTSRYPTLEKFSFDGIASAHTSVFAELSPIRSKLSSFASRYSWLWPWSLRAAFFFAIHTIVIEYIFIMIWFMSRKEDTPMYSSLPIDAIAMIAVGAYAQTNLAAGLIESLQKHGPHPDLGLKSYLLTDYPECFQGVELFENLTIVPLKISNEGTELQKTLKAKSFKTKLFDYLPNDVQDVLYLDIDIRVTDTFPAWLDSLHEKLGDEAHDIVIPGERIYADSPFNSGVMILDRESSADCLQTWGDEILSGRYDMDQHALVDIRESGKHCKNMLILDHSDTMLYMRDFFSMLFFELGIARKAPMLHFTSSQHLIGEMEEGCSGIWSCARLWMVERVYLREKLDHQKQCGNV